MTMTAGLDIGGAHLKVALADERSVVAVEQYAAPLWQGLDTLDAAIAAAGPLLSQADAFAITMTGELSDLFDNRRQGVDVLVRRATRAFGDGTRFWLGARGFAGPGEALAHPADVGSTNFLATATWIGRQPGFEDALLIDFGSTTADIIPIDDGRPVAAGMTDAVRQTTGELVYTGYTRTAVMAVATSVPIDGRWVTLAREYLATMADVRRVLGEDLLAVDLHATADGKGKSRAESMQRLARMTGRDASEAAPDAWITAAAHIREAQLRSISDGAHLVLSRTAVPLAAPVVAAGIGCGDVVRLAQRLDRPAVLFGDLVGDMGLMKPHDQAALRERATWSAPAVAMALLSAQPKRV